MEANQLQYYAELGARERLKELEESRQEILRLFPNLTGKPVIVTVPSKAKSALKAVPKAKRTARRVMTQTQKQAIRKRMLAYWKDKRQAKAS